MTVARAYSATVAGLEGRTVVVEAAIGAGLPALTIVGLPDAAVKESRERIRSALRHVGFPLPSKNVVVNLAPADLPKSGTALDLAVALAILAANGDLPAEALAKTTLVGELALDGELRGVPGVLSFAETSRREERALLVPAENAEEAAAVPSLHVFAAPHLGAAIAHLLAREVLPRVLPSAVRPPTPGSEPDLADVRGQAVARRALEIAAAGGHNILFSGPPGAGKTMLARRLPGILPPLSREESLDATRIWSVAGRLPAGSGLLTQRPFRAPHHGASAAALAGGGADPRPGELSLAHFGVLFLDELPGIPKGRARSSARAARRRRRLRRPRGRSAHVSRPLPPRRRDEPVPLRLPRRSAPCLHLLAAGRGALPPEDLRAAPRSNRPACRGAGARRVGPGRGRRRREVGRGPCARGEPRGRDRRRAPETRGS